MNSEVTAKLQKLLARADTNRGSSEAEAKTAMEMAQRLATEHGLDLAQLSVDTGAAPALDLTREEVAMNTANERNYHFPIMDVLQTCFGVKVVISSFWTRTAVRKIEKVTILGEKVDVAVASYCWTMLLDLFPKAWGEYRKATGASGWVSERSYFKGLAQGINAANKRVEEKMTQASPGYALVVANKADALVAYANKVYPKMKNVKTHQDSVDHGAASAGFRKGTTVKFNPNSLL